MRSAISLFGPTASGKTSLAISLARELNGVIINADSRQIYKHMPILTAMPSDEEFLQAEHRLFSFLEPSESFSVSDYMDKVCVEMESVWQSGKVPILCGGTGFYLSGVMEGISPVPNVSSNIVDDLNLVADQEGLKPLVDELRRVDPEIVPRIDLNNKIRVIRALSVYRQTGKRLSSFQSKPRQGSVVADWLKVAISPEREVLYERIEKRFSLMMRQGLEKEMRDLKAMGFDLSAQGMTGIGILEFFSYFDGEMTLDDVADQMTKATRNYAKRQVTWLRTQYHPDVLLHSMNDVQMDVFSDFLR